MKTTTMGAIIGLVIIVVILLIAMTMGWIPGLGLQSERPPGATDSDCDYTELQILQMLEEITGKELNNGQGISFVRALNMEVCGSNEASASVISHFKNEYGDWDLASEDILTRDSGWTVYSLLWTQGANTSFAKSIMVGEGSTVQQAYGYTTMTLTADGPYVTYQAFVIWLLSS